MIEAILRYPFMQNAVFAALLSSLLCGIIGVIIVEKKMLMMSGGIAHTAYGGVGLGYFLGFSPMLGAVLFSLAAAFSIGTMRRRGAATDVLIALFWSLGMAMGICFIALTPGYPPDLNSYLFGNILMVSASDLLLMLILSLVVLLVLVALFADFKAYLFDSGFATLSGIKTTLLEYILFALIALTVVVLIRVSGIMLAIALLSAPAACASHFSGRLSGRMIGACVFSAFFTLGGLTLSYYLNVSSGATIILLSVLTYFVLYLAKRFGKLGKQAGK